MTPFEEAVKAWLGKPLQVYDYSATDTKKYLSKDPKVRAAEMSKVRYVDGPPRYVVPEGWEIESLDLKHEEGWSNDSGTHWPASVDIIVTRVKVGPKGQKHRRKDTVFASDDPIEFMKELFVDG